MANESTGPGGVPIRTMAEHKDMTRAKMIWKGPPKVGKTSTAAAIRTVSDKYDLGLKPFFMLFEAGSDGVQVEGTSQSCPVCEGTGKAGKKKCSECGGIGTTRKILSTRKEIREWFEWVIKSPYNIVVIDTGDRFYQAIMDDVCVEMGIVSPFGANDMGITWAVIFDEMRELLGILEAGNVGIIMCMHVYMQEKRVSGGSIQQAVFNVPGKAKTYLAGFADQVLHFDIMPNPDGEGDKHVLIGEAQSGIEAGDRWGIFPAETDLGKTPEEAAEAILTKFGYLE